MYAVKAVRRGDERSAATLREHARDLTTTVLSALAPSTRTVAAEILVMRFVERFGVAIGTADWSVLLRWVDASSQRYAGILPVFALLSAAAGAVLDTLGEGDDLIVVRGEVERLASQPRLVQTPALREAIDEIDVTLDDLVTRLEQNDPLTAEHSRAVSAWCAKLAHRLALSKSDALHATRSGLIHDVGKITTPLCILQAARSLSDEEYAVMRLHADEGAKIIAATPLATHLVPGVRNHHERFDGRGYPDGIAGAAIPSVARIVCVADAFNAMIGRRPYRSPFAPAVALERLKAERGTQFDPIVVDAMIDIVNNRL